MERHPVASSTIESIGYDEESGTLEVGFIAGGVYQYFDVPLHEFEALMQAGSKGAYLATQIKKQYRYSRV